MTYLIITGNPVDGLRFIGPFDSAEEANQHADDLMASYEEWWTAEMEAP
jgi:hypothetical protein